MELGKERQSRGRRRDQLFHSDCHVLCRSVIFRQGPCHLSKTDLLLVHAECTLNQLRASRPVRSQSSSTTRRILRLIRARQPCYRPCMGSFSAPLSLSLCRTYARAAEKVLPREFQQAVEVRHLTRRSCPSLEIWLTSSIPGVPADRVRGADEKRSVFLEEVEWAVGGSCTYAWTAVRGFAWCVSIFLAALWFLLVSDP